MPELVEVFKIQLLIDKPDLIGIAELLVDAIVYVEAMNAQNPTTDADKWSVPDGPVFHYTVSKPCYFHPPCLKHD